MFRMPFAGFLPSAFALGFAAATKGFDRGRGRNETGQTCERAREERSGRLGTPPFSREGVPWTYL